MPPTKARHGPKASGTRGRSRAKPKQAPSLPTSKWPHLAEEKRSRQSLNPQPGNAFLSLQISSLDSHIAEKGWLLLSERASLFSPQRAAHEVLQLAKQHQEQVEQQQQRQKEKLEQRYLVRQNVAFLTLKFSTNAWEKSQIPLAQSWRARQITNIEPGVDQKTQTGNIKPLSSQSRKPPFSSVLPNDFEDRQQRITRGNSVLSVTADRDFRFDIQVTPEAPDFSPITPTASIAPEYLTPWASTSLINIRTDPPDSDLEYPYSDDPYTMSGKLPVDTGGVDESIKDVIQNLFVIQQHVASFRPEIQDGLNRKVEDLAVSLQKLDDQVASPSNPIHSIKIAPDIIDYVDDGRNPDIYTRDFVELVQRGNAVLNGKQRAFRNLSKILAKSLKDNFDGMDEEVDTIMQNAGMEEKNGSFIEKHQNGRAA